MGDIIWGQSFGMRQVAAIVRLVAPRRCNVLICGETGTGKEVVARAIHESGSRAGRPMVAINCAALPETLLEAELFGHVRGAFTGAFNHRAGRFEQADGGTLFLDEIGEMPLSLQAKLLRVLQEREFQRLGSSETVRVDVRLIAATNVDLAARVREGRFREDLYYRLNVVPILLPPLRDRREDIPALVDHFLDRICQGEALAPKNITAEALGLLGELPWPGNVRQLENAVEMAIALSGDRTELTSEDFQILNGSPLRAAGVIETALSDFPDSGLDFEQTVGAVERNLLEQALRRTGGNKTLAAELLGLKRTTLTAKLRTLGSQFPLARAAGM